VEKRIQVTDRLFIICESLVKNLYSPRGEATEIVRTTHIIKYALREL
jgi:hypothetical protein